MYISIVNEDMHMCFSIQQSSKQFRLHVQILKLSLGEQGQWKRVYGRGSRNSAPQLFQTCEHYSQVNRTKYMWDGIAQYTHKQHTKLLSIFKKVAIQHFQPNPPFRDRYTSCKRLITCVINITETIHGMLGGIPLCTCELLNHNPLISKRCPQELKMLIFIPIIYKPAI